MNNLSVPGNPESVRILEHFLALAKQGMVGHVSLVAGANAVKRLWPKLDSWLGKRST